MNGNFWRGKREILSTHFAEQLFSKLYFYHFWSARKIFSGKKVPWSKIYLAVREIKKTLLFFFILYEKDKLQQCFLPDTFRSVIFVEDSQKKFSFFSYCSWVWFTVCLFFTINIKAGCVWKVFQRWIRQKNLKNNLFSCDSKFYF